MTPSTGQPRRGRLAAAAQQLLELRLPDATRRLTSAERRADGVATLVFLLVAGAMVLGLPGSPPHDWTQAAALVCGLALLARILVQIGSGFMVPTQLLFVPLLLLTPAPWVPLLVGAAMVLTALPEVLVRRLPAERLLSAMADASYCLGPALLLALAGPGPGPAWSAWPLYLAALALQFLTDLAVSTAREWYGTRTPPDLQAGVMVQVYVVDALLAPIGLLAAFASVTHELAFLLTLPLAAGLALFVRERNGRIARALELVEELRAERQRTQRAQRRIGETVASTLDREALWRIVVDTAVELVGADGGRLSTRATAGDLFEEAARAGELDAVEPAVAAVEAALSSHSGLAEATVNGVTALGHHLRRDAGSGSPAVQCLVVARRGGAFAAAERELLRGLTEQAAASMQNLELHERVKRQAVTDELTGLLNHRRLQEILEREVRLSRRYDSGLALIMLDIDDFKRVNDTYGHQQGDRVLRELSATLARAIREVDRAARYGGEELAVALPRLDLDGAIALAERIREAIAQLEIPLAGGGSMRVSASLGVAALGGGVQDREQLVAAADAALYRAKRAGKDRVVAADAPARLV